MVKEKKIHIFITKKQHTESIKFNGAFKGEGGIPGSDPLKTKQKKNENS